MSTRRWRWPDLTLEDPIADCVLPNLSIAKSSINGTWEVDVGKPPMFTGRNLIARGEFLLLADSRASFEIEGEKPPRNRLGRWGRAVLQAGRSKLTLKEIIQLHAVLIENMRLTQAGLRPNRVFLAEGHHQGVRCRNSVSVFRRLPD